MTNLNLIAIQTAHLLITLANACHYLNATWCSEVNKCWCNWCSNTDTIFTQSDSNVPSVLAVCLQYHAWIVTLVLIYSSFINEQNLLPGPKLFVFVGILQEQYIQDTDLLGFSLRQPQWVGLRTVYQPFWPISSLMTDLIKKRIGK